jgi:hypothetical protein
MSFSSSRIRRYSQLVVHWINRMVPCFSIENWSFNCPHHVFGLNQRKSIISHRSHWSVQIVVHHRRCPINIYLIRTITEMDRQWFCSKHRQVCYNNIRMVCVQSSIDCSFDHWLLSPIDKFTVLNNENIMRDILDIDSDKRSYERLWRCSSRQKDEEQQESNSCRVFDFVFPSRNEFRYTEQLQCSTYISINRCQQFLLDNISFFITISNIIITRY